MKLRIFQQLKHVASYKTSVVLTVHIGGRQGDLQPHKAPTKQYASCSFLPKDSESLSSPIMRKVSKLYEQDEEKPPKAALAVSKVIQFGLVQMLVEKREFTTP